MHLKENGGIYGIYIVPCFRGLELSGIQRPLPDIPLCALYLQILSHYNPYRKYARQVLFATC